MRKIIILFLILLLFPAELSFAWRKQKDVRFEDLDGDYVGEIILVSGESGGTGTYREEMRIYKDKNPELELIFQIETLHDYGHQMNRGREESQVTFLEDAYKSGMKDILVTHKHIIYEEKGVSINETIDSGEQIFVWDGTKYVNKER